MHALSSLPIFDAVKCFQVTWKHNIKAAHVMLRQCLQEMQTAEPLISEAFLTKNWESLRRLSHQLAGAVAYCDLARLQAAILMLHEAASTQSVSEELFQKFKKILQDTENLVQNLEFSEKIEKKLELGKPQPEKLEQYYQSHLYLTNILSYLPAHLYWFDTNSIVLGCNDSQAKTFGLKKGSELIGKTIFEVGEQMGWNPDTAEIIRANDVEVMSQRQPSTIEETMMLDDELKTYVSHKHPLLDEKGNVIGVMGVSIDVTPVKESEKALRKAKEQLEATDRAKSEFIMNMSHDIKTPLSSIISLLSQLEIQEPDPIKKEKITHSLQSGRQLLSMFKDILRLVKVESGEQTILRIPFEPHDLLQEVQELMTVNALDKHLTLSMDYSSQIPDELLGDPLRLKRVLLNLISNAIKFTEQGGISIKIRVLAQDSKQVQIEIQVKDTGIGIPKEKHAAIFERFTRLTSAYEGKYEGTGVGLYIVHRFVEEMGGEIQVKSQVGKGTCFTVTLPFLIPQNENQKTKKVEKKRLKLDSRAIYSVLLVEDNPTAQLAARGILKEQLQFDVDTAGTGKEAIKLATRNAYDLILMDIGLPDMDGFTITRTIRDTSDLNRKTPIIGLTAHIDPEEKAKIKASGLTDLVEKPLTLDLFN